METLEITKKKTTTDSKTTTTSLSGSEAVLEILLAQKVKTIFGHPGGAIMTITPPSGTASSFALRSCV